jgi:hypothetical protein
MMDRRPLACLLPEADQRARRDQTLSTLFQTTGQSGCAFEGRKG